MVAALPVVTKGSFHVEQQVVSSLPWPRVKAVSICHSNRSKWWVEWSKGWLLEGSSPSDGTDSFLNLFDTPIHPYW